MMRRLPALAAAVALIGAAPAPFPPITFTTPWNATGQDTPASLPSRFTPAPVPDLSLEPPAPRSSGHTGASLSPNVFHQQRVYEGDGFTPGSTPDDESSKRQKPRAGLNLSVPLQ